jgi:hypothetical protein
MTKELPESYVLICATTADDVLRKSIVDSVELDSLIDPYDPVALTVPPVMFAVEDISPVNLNPALGSHLIKPVELEPNAKAALVVFGIYPRYQPLSESLEYADLFEYIDPLPFSSCKSLLNNVPFELKPTILPRASVICAFVESTQLEVPAPVETYILFAPLYPSIHTSPAATAVGVEPSVVLNILFFVIDMKCPDQTRIQ